MKAIQMAYTDPGISKFKTLFYNVVDPSQRDRYVRPPTIPLAMWSQAEHDNPDAQNCAPAPVQGLQQLRERMDAQNAHVVRMQAYVETLKTSLQTLEGAGRSASQLQDKCRAEQQQLSHTMLRVARKLEVLRCLNIPTHNEEVQFRERLVRLQAVLVEPTQFKGRLREIVCALRMQEERAPEQVQPLVETDLATIYQALEAQRNGLHHLTLILQKDMRDVAIMSKGLAARSRAAGRGGAMVRYGDELAAARP